jgi:ABC-type antimicrobial peptide transport system permease subunit
LARELGLPPQVPVDVVRSILRPRLLLAGIGIYGVISYSVALRQAENGVRVALGATRTDALRMILGRRLKLIAIGVAAGIGGALAFSSVISSMLFGIQTRDAAAGTHLSRLSR